MSEIILLLEEDAATAAIVQDVLHQAEDGFFKVEWSRNCAAALKRLNDGAKSSVAAVIIDVAASGRKPLDTFDRIFKSSSHIPILLLSTAEQEGVARQGVRGGAKDYLLCSRLDIYTLPKALHDILERSACAESLFMEKERAHVTLNSIGDAVISTDVTGVITYLNPVAESMTGWTSADALGRPAVDVFRVFDRARPGRRIDPLSLAVRENRVVGLPEGSMLVRRDGVRSAVEDSAAPIHDRRGRVTGAVTVFRDITGARATPQQMYYLAHHDYLTDLPNRLLLDDRLAQAIADCSRQHEQLAVLFVDVDRFKHINDSLGHAIGDELLQSIARRLESSVRACDNVTRQGGDEFVILLSTIARAHDAASSANKILISLGRPHHIKQHELQVSASIGIALYPDHGEDPETLLKNADVAMLNAKESGRNNYQFFRPEMSKRALERQSMESGFRNALDNHEFLLHYQPKMDLERETITGAEALIRWRHPGRGIVHPDEFIPVAEQSGYIVPIGRWVLREACRQVERWLDNGLTPYPVAINISAVELRSKDFVRSVRDVLTETGLDSQYLELELTETALMQDSASILEVVTALKDMGVRLALDDFGTGYSSLNYLKRFPIDALKIDKSFVRGLCIDHGDASIVSAVINMGKSFHLKVIAEGVETREQFLRLQAQQCAEGQGYYFQEPVAADEFAKLLSTDLSTTIVA